MDELNHKTTGPANGIEIDSCLGPNELNNPVGHEHPYGVYFLSTPRDPCHPTLKTSPRDPDVGITSSREVFIWKA